MDINIAVQAVIDGSISINQAAKQAGVAAMTLHRKVAKHPDYEAAKADGRIKQKLALNPVNVEDLANHPAVRDVIDNGLSYAVAGEKHGVVPMTLHRWVQKVAPKPTVPLGIVRSPEFVAMKAALHSLASKVGVSPEDLSRALVAQA